VQVPYDVPVRDTITGRGDHLRQPADEGGGGFGAGIPCTVGDFASVRSADGVPPVGREGCVSRGSAVGIDPRTYALREPSVAVTPASLGASVHVFRLWVRSKHPVLRKFAPRVMSRGVPLGRSSFYVGAAT
jgi:hypothetical protein